MCLVGKTISVSFASLSGFLKKKNIFMFIYSLPVLPSLVFKFGVLLFHFFNETQFNVKENSLD